MASRRYPIDWMKGQGEALRAAGRSFDVSIGGATGRDIAAGLDVDSDVSGLFGCDEDIGADDD